jgi:hypothetical protein
MLLEELLKALLPDDRLTNALAGTKDGRLHPVAYLLQHSSTPETDNTARALQWIRQNDASWLTGDRNKRLLDTTDFSNAASVLAELRAYGYLGIAGFNPVPVPTASTRTPDFLVRSRRGDPLEVEVHAKHLSPSATAAMAEGVRRREELRHDLREGGIGTVETEVRPFGDAVKPGDTNITNAISKVASIKAGDHQFHQGMPGLYWLDFQDVHNWNMALTADAALPVLSFREELWSGSVWYGLYGQKGLPVFEGFNPRLHPGGVFAMAHDGRFLQTGRVAAVLVSLPSATIMLEHPQADIPLPAPFRMHFIELPHARVELSILNWTPNEVDATASIHRKLIEALARSGPEFN